jgi:hypothetical protein
VGQKEDQITSKMEEEYAMSVSERSERFADVVCAV